MYISVSVFLLFNSYRTTPVYFNFFSKLKTKKETRHCLVRLQLRVISFSPYRLPAAFHTNPNSVISEPLHFSNRVHCYIDNMTKHCLVCEQ